MKNSKGFTMVEMIIVIAIIAVLAMVVIPAISKYIDKGNKDYNKELITQLEISGKNYYSENKSKLPNKPYNEIALISSSYVGLSTLQSNNFVSKDFVDSRGVSCEESYVYVMQSGGSTENEYHPCLICGDVNYSEEYYNDPYCNISNWDDKTDPSCNLVSDPGTNDKTKVVDVGGKKTYYNPTSINVTASDLAGAAGKDGKVAYIVIEIEENGTDNKIDRTTIDVSKMSEEQIKSRNLLEFFPKDKDGKIVEGEYIIKVLDEGGNQSTCLLNKDDNPGEPTIRVIMDNTKPSCDLVTVQRKKDEKYITFDMNKTKDNWSKQDRLQVLIDEKSDKTESYIINELSGYKYSLKGKPDGTYYGYVKDEAGNIGTCDKDVQIKMFEDEKPYCLLSSKSNVYQYVKRNGETLHNTECYLYKGEKGDYDLSKIELKDKTLGTIDPKVNSDKNENKNNKIVIDIPFKVNNSGDGYENIILKEGTVKVGDLTNDEKKVQENDFYVDTTFPGIDWSIDQTQKYDSKTKTYYYEKGVKITATCTDTGSKMKSATISGKGTNITNATISDSQKSSTITNNVKGKNLEYKVVCVDNAGNEKTYTNKYNVKEYSADSTCGCKTYKECRTKDCGCKTAARCSAAGCGDYTKWKLYQSRDLYSNCGVIGTYNSPKCRACSSYTNEYTKQVCGDCRLTRCHTDASGSQGRHRIVRTAKIYKRSCNYYRQSLAKCGCEQWKTCEASACGCKIHNECWHY